MNKIISINLKGIIFQVEEEAYDRLKQYLETLNRHFANDESRLEIIDDIESRMAEMMQERLKTKAAITVADVEEIIAIMGKPTDFDTEGGETTGEQAESNSDAYNTPPHATEGPRRFFRDTENSFLGGVCAGAGHYFGIDPLWVRLGFLFLFFIMGTGLLFYIILWVIVPVAKTPSDRLQMKGEQVNIENIEKAVKEEYERVKKNFDEYRRGKHTKVNQTLHRGVGMAGDIVLAFVKFIAGAVGVGFIIVSILLFIVLVSLAAYLVINGTLPIISLAFENTADFWLVVSSLVLLLLLMVMGFIAAALRLFNPQRKVWRNRALTYPVSALSTLAVIVLVVMGIKYGRSFSSRQSVVETVSLKQGDTLTVTAFNPVYYRLAGEYNNNEVHYYNRGGMEEIWDGVYFVQNSSNALLNDSLWHIARFEVQRSSKQEWELEIIRKAYGKDDYMARAYAEKIPLDYRMEEGKLVMNTHFYSGRGIPYRDQEIIYRLWVPQGKVLKFEAGLIEIMEYGLKHRLPHHNSYGARHHGMTWQMGENGLKCLDCPTNEKSTVPADSKRYYFQDFTRVNINIPAGVQIIEGTEYEVLISGPDRVKNEVNVSVQGNTLAINYDDGLFDIFDGIDRDDVQIIIKMPRLERLEASGANTIEIAGLSAQTMDIELSGACKLQGKIAVKNLELELNGSSTAELVGEADNVTVDITGASKLKAYDLAAQNYTIDAAGASTLQIWASSQISADASGASHITYKGKPELKTKTTGASTINPAN